MFDRGNKPWVRVRVRMY